MASNSPSRNQEQVRPDIALQSQCFALLQIALHRLFRHEVQIRRPSEAKTGWACNTALSDFMQTLYQGMGFRANLFALRQRLSRRYCDTFHVMELVMKTWFVFAFVLLLFLSACQSTTPDSSTTGCPTVTGTPARLEIPPDALPTLTPGPLPTPVLMKIRGKDVQINKAVEGPLCNDIWSGTVYVTCNVQVYPWEEAPDLPETLQLEH